MIELNAVDFCFLVFTFDFLFKLPDLNAPVRDLVTVVLQKNMPLVCFAEIFPDHILADGNKIPVFF